MTDIFELDNEDFFRYLQLKDNFIKEMQFSKTLNGVLETTVPTSSGTRFKAISVLYHNLRDYSAISTMYIKTEWEKELNTQNTIEE